MKIQNLAINYGKKRILSQINLDIHPGEFCYIIGSSGSGKTSLLHALMGGKELSEGSIDVPNFGDISKLQGVKLREYRQKLGVVFQDFKLLSKKTVQENVSFAMEVCGYSSQEIGGQLPDILNQVGLLGKKDQFIEHLSGGEQQRVALARALIHNPDIILADEPTGNLDSGNAGEVLKIFINLHKKGKTIILATHDSALISKYPQKVVEISRGILI